MHADDHMTETEAPIFPFRCGTDPRTPIVVLSRISMCVCSQRRLGLVTRGFYYPYRVLSLQYYVQKSKRDFATNKYRNAAEMRPFNFPTAVQHSEVRQYE